MAQQIPPPAKDMTPSDYYMMLTRQGVPTWQAYDAVTANYGTPEQVQEEYDKASEPGLGYQIGQLGGIVGGAALGREIAQGAPNIIGLFGGGAGGAATTGAATTGAATTAAATTAGATGIAGGAGAGAAGALGAAGATQGVSVAAPQLLGGANALGAGGGTSGLLSAGVALPVAAAVIGAGTIWEDGLRNVLTGKAKTKDWTNLGIDFVGGTGINFVLRSLGKRSIGEMMRSGKSNDQKMRDGFRRVLQATGVADKDYQVTLANGDKFDIGKDGRATLANVDGSDRRYWNWDEGNPLAKYAVSIIDPKIRNTFGEQITEDGQHPEQYTAMLVNAVTSNAKTEQDVLNNINAIFNEAPAKNKPDLFPTQQSPGKSTKPGQYKPGQSAQQLAQSVSGMRSPEPLTSEQDIPALIRGISGQSPQSPLQVFGQVQQGTMPQPMQWSKEAQQRELTRRLQGRKR